MPCDIFSTKFYGTPDEFDQRTGEGIETFCYKNFQKHKGEFLQDNIHGNGKYTILSPTDRLLYEGTFYTNSLHGYNNVYYGEGELFEGLFEDHKRYGPGIFTHSNNTQDVGIWLGHSLIKLSRVVKPQWVPNLTRSNAGKAHLLKFRNLVSVENYHITPEDRIMKTYTNIPELVQNSQQICNKFVSHPRSLPFFKKLHEEKFFGQEDYEIDVLVPVERYNDIAFGENEEIMEEILENLIEEESFREVENILTPLEKLGNILAGKDDCDCKGKCLLTVCELEEFLTEERDAILQRLMLSKPTFDKFFSVQKVFVHALLAWNNNALYEDILKFCFKCRKFEEKVTFCVEDVLTGHRELFLSPGEHELACLELLNSCSNGDYKKIYREIAKHELNPDVSDLKGIYLSRY